MLVLVLTHLVCRAEFDHQTGLLVPDESQSLFCLKHQINAHSVDLIGDVLAFILFDNCDFFLIQLNFSILK